MGGDLTSSGVGQRVRDLGIEAQNLCNCGNIPAAKQAFLQMLSNVKDGSETRFCINTHALIVDTETKLMDEPVDLLQIYTDRINAEPVQIARAKLVLDAALFLTDEEFSKLFRLKSVKAIHPTIKKNFFTPEEFKEEEIFVEVLVPKLRASVGTRTGNPKKYKDKKVFVSPT